jgi:myo-inositol-1(or 4)-monophosphatase
MDDASHAARLLADIERTALELATLAGAEITRALGGNLSVRYKTSAGETTAFRDPVSDVDERVEDAIRLQVGRRFPDHAVVGEEGAPTGESPFVWAIDPIDGTTNFVNGFPLFSASIGVLHEGRPIAGALWCSTSHALRAGVYHAREGGPLSFENEALRPSAPSEVRRRLAGMPRVERENTLEWDVRKTGSASIECAFVAARLLEAARFGFPNVWDVAGGIALVHAAGGIALQQDGDGWRLFEGFGRDMAAIKAWRNGLVVGPEAAARRLADATTPAAG